MRRVFDRSTAWTLNSLYVKGATKQSLTARVWFKDYDDPRHYLLPQVYGGSRPQKRLEVLLTRLGVMRADERAVPAAGARLDAYGNMGRGQVQQIISQLKGFYLAGASQNASNSKRSRAKRAAESYFASTGKGTHPLGTGAWIRARHQQHLARGVWCVAASARLARPSSPSCCSYRTQRIALASSSKRWQRPPSTACSRATSTWRSRRPLHRREVAHDRSPPPRPRGGERGRPTPGC